MAETITLECAQCSGVVVWSRPEFVDYIASDALSAGPADAGAGR